MLILSTISIPGQGGLFEKIKTYDKKIFRGTLNMDSTFPVSVHEIEVHFFKNDIEKTNDTSLVVAGKWSFQTDVSNWPSGDYEVKFFAQDINGTVLDQITITITVESDVPEGTDPGSVFNTDFLDDFKDKTFNNKIKLETTTPDVIKKIQIKIEKGQEVKVEETTEISKNSWKFEEDVKDWETGTYEVTIKALDASDVVVDSANFNIKIKKEAPFYMPTFCAIMLIVFIVLFIVIFILSLLKHKKIMAELRFEPKNVQKKLPLMAYMSMFLTLLLVLAGTAAIITAELELMIFLVFLAGLGLLMLFTYWTFSNRNYPYFILYLIFGIISIIIISMISLWSPSDGLGLIIGSGLLAAGLLLFFVSILFYWLISRRGFLIPMVVVVLALAFSIIHIVLIVLSIIDLFISWWLVIIVGSILAYVLLLLSWLVLREDMFYFENREESKTHRGTRKTLNMFDVLSTPSGIFKRTYDRKVMAKISYEQTHDKKVRTEVIQLRDWDSPAGKAQGRRIMGVYVNKMSGKEGPMFNKVRVAESVKYTTYSSDTNLDDKLKLVKSFGFQVMESGKERGLDYYDLELVKRPLFGLGLGGSMGADKPKMDFEKGSGWKHGKDLKKDKEKIKGPGAVPEKPDRDDSYDYEREREKEREAQEREAQQTRERERDQEVERDHARRRDDRGRDEEVEDWGRRRERQHERGYDERSREDSERRRRYDQERQRERDRRPPPRREREERSPAPDRWPIQKEEAPPEKPKKRPPPPRIIKD